MAANDRLADPARMGPYAQRAKIVGEAVDAEAKAEWANCATLWENCLLQFPDDRERPTWLERRAKALEAARQFDEAINCYLELMTAYPGHPSGNDGAARLLRLLGDSKSAYPRDASIAVPPGNDNLTDGLKSRGYALLATGQYEAAGKVFNALAAQHPERHDGYLGLVDVAQLQWRWPVALEQCDKCLEVAPPEMRVDLIRKKADSLIQMGHFDEAKQHLETIRDQLLGVEALAQIATLTEQPHIAAQRWDECAAKFPGEPTGFLGKARLLFNREAYAEAGALLEHVVATWPESVAAAALWGRCATAAKNWQTAKNRWQQIVTKYEAHTEVVGGYARYLAAVDDQVAFHAYLDRIQSDTRAATELRLEYYLAGDNLGAVLEQSVQLIRLEPEKIWHRLRHASLLMREGSRPGLHAAFWFLRDLYHRSPQMTAIRCQLAECLIKAGFAEQAAEMIKAIPEQEKRTEVKVLRAWLRHCEGDDESAKRHWSGILERQYVAAVHAPIENMVRLGDRNLCTEPGEILLFSVMYNERDRLKWFLDYYRKLGVNKFVIVDNCSTDGSVELLVHEPDVILYRTTDQYSISGSGMRWINEMIERHGQKNWCLHVDADEAFIFPRWGEIGLRGLVEYLDRRGYECMLGRLIDLYPENRQHGSSAEEMSQLQSPYVFFDNEFHVYDIPVCPYREIYGGVRRRLMGGYQMLNKVPLINGAAGIKFLLSSHRTTPASVADVNAALLHYHLIYLLEPRYQTVLAEAIERREFPSNSLERLRSRDLLQEFHPSETLLYEESTRYVSAEQLARIGILEVGEAFTKTDTGRKKKRIGKVYGARRS